MQGYRSVTAMALLSSLGVMLGATQASAQTACDEDSNGYVTADEAAACADRDYSTLLGDDDAVTRERFDAAFPDSESLDEMWADADANRDDLLSQEEWADWSERRFRAANPSIEGMSVDDYEALEAQYHMGDDQEGRGETPAVDEAGAAGSGGTDEGTTETSGGSDAGGSDEDDSGSTETSGGSDDGSGGDSTSGSDSGNGGSSGSDTGGGSGGGSSGSGGGGSGG